ncbi:MAG: ABC transporter permease [Pelagibacteraceae bacterium]|nr:ABC transporter permease [Pelagibacteraceae bacterium]MBT3902419.1 ABC transporter permease [Pelagibacteraceae bacterium]MBT5213133.1 ABC transporter permease [Pelagibacteraceae bacterium]MBT6354092.1 ABC transporter permease [Pelagibacteraceae bacterium]
MIQEFAKELWVEISSQKKEAYFTATQFQLVRTRFFANRSAMIAGSILLFMIVISLFAGFLSPYDPTIAGRDKQYENGSPELPMFWDENGFSLRPFIHTKSKYRGADTNFRWVYKVDTEKRKYLQFFVKGWEYKYFKWSINLPGKKFDFKIPGLTFDTHLFGVDSGGIHIFGTDKAGKDLFSRTLAAIYISLAVGTLGVFISFVLSLIVGGIAGYYGGWIDGIAQMFTDAVRTIPPIPLFMCLAAFAPDTWSSEMRFFFISCLLGFISWPTLARRVRTHLLTERSQEYILAAKLCGASSTHIIIRHLLPSFTSYIIVDLVISFPYMLLSETALSFIGLGLREPVNSLGVLLQSATRADVLLNYQWYFLPVLVLITLILSFVFVGDGLRDAADPHKNK